MTNQGYAKKRYSEIYQSQPWLAFEDLPVQSLASLLEIYLTQRRISYFDYDLAYRLLGLDFYTHQEVALFLCHLSLASKAGHVCIELSSQSLIPSVKELWHNEEGEVLNSDEADLLTEKIAIGAQNLPKRLLTQIDGLKTASQTPICRVNNHFYLHCHWVYETALIDHLRKHLNTSPHLIFNASEVEQTIAQLCQQQTLLKEQGEAILQGYRSPLTLITGGPGTGKTYTVGHLIKVFVQHLCPEKRRTCQIVLAAPTGKAAANLQQSLNRVELNCLDLPPIQTKTLHALLGMKHHSQTKTMLSADLLIVDESSMIDIKMMTALFESLKPGSRLILIGDRYQLPPVEAGSIFQDLIQSYLFEIPCIHLTTCMRVELKTLITFSEQINQGLSQKVLERLREPSASGLKQIKLAEDQKKGQHQLIEHVAPNYKMLIQPGFPPDQLLKSFQSFRLLTSMRKGHLGVEALNQAIWLKLCQNLPMNGFLAIPIMILSNDYTQDLFNGETGVLVRRLPMHTIDREDYALFPSRQEIDGVRRISAFTLPKYEFAYCLSIHKSQGSEFDHVGLVLPKGSELFGRQLFYTAVTRARKSLEIYASDHIIQKTVEHQHTRFSSLTSSWQIEN